MIVVLSKTNPLQDETAANEMQPSLCLVPSSHSTSRLPSDSWAKSELSLSFFPCCLSPSPQTARMEASASHMTPLRVALYAAHDTTVMPLLLALAPPTPAPAGAADEGLAHWPPYASSVAFELWGPRDPKAAAGEKGHFVRVLYNGEAMDLPCSTGGRHGGRHCSLTDFRLMLSPFLPVDFAAECHLADGTDPGAKDTGMGGHVDDDEDKKAAEKPPAAVVPAAAAAATPPVPERKRARIG